ncbi:MAG: minichromosome maintenance protein MCM [Archaeoglobaceae archaeon]|nr:minichromosome maintenance protein MCM [Archaeoglobaceae archaeon]MCX8151750.1 minichromosome maintenance protein MCM [Archaeoglobaceae archaeon]MDW8014280.1 minichromosome maintenance protein MCM [Archaeoglobaceae archaeon]
MISSPEIWTQFFERYYQEELNKLAYSIKTGGDGRSILVNFKDLLIFQEGKLAEELLENPDNVIKHAKEGLENTTNIYGVSLKNCKPRFYSLPAIKKYLVRDLRAEHIGKFVAIEGIVRKVTEVRPKIVEAAFGCANCGKINYVVQEDNLLKQPSECSKCHSKKLVFLPNDCKAVDSQRVKIQEYPENLKGGEQPQSIDVVLEEDVAGKVNPGDRVIINGIVRARTRGRNIYMDLFVEGNSIEILQQEYEEVEITEEDKKKIIQLVRDGNIYEKVVKSIAPSIYGYEEIKLAIALQLFGGVPKKLPDGTEIRGDIHVLLVGDPGVAKSQLLRYVHRIAPRSIYTTGKGTTTAGLTATAVRDEIDGRWTLEAGALVLADKGIALVDEIDKMRKEDHAALHEALEQQTISVAKAGINAILKARCSLLAAANPKYGRFDRFTPIAEQIDLTPTLISRFDLIFVMADQPNEEKDKNLAKHIVEVHQLGEYLEKKKNVGMCEDLSKKIKKVEPSIDPELLRKYVAFTRKTIFPVMTEEAMKKLEEFYVSLRTKAKGNSPVPITARQLESLIRLSEASARMRLSEKVEIEDAERVIEIMKKSLMQIAIDPETGEFDIDYVYSGTTKRQRDRILIVKKIIQELETKTNFGAPEEDVLEACEREGIEIEKAREILSKLKQFGEVYSLRYGYYKLVSR